VGIDLDFLVGPGQTLNQLLALLAPGRAVEVAELGPLVQPAPGVMLKSRNEHWESKGP